MGLVAERATLVCPNPQLPVGVTYEMVGMTYTVGPVLLIQAYCISTGAVWAEAAGTAPPAGPRTRLTTRSASTMTQPPRRYELTMTSPLPLHPTMRSALSPPRGTGPRIR